MHVGPLRRREFLSLIGGALAVPPLSAMAQPAGKVHRVGVLFARSRRGSMPDEAFRLGLRDHGYVEGQNVAIEFRTATGRFDDLARLAAELVDAKVDVIFAPVEAALRASLSASRTIPIVIAAIGYDPVALGLVAGTVTGVAFSYPDSSVRRLQLLKQAMPDLTQVSALIESGRVPREDLERAAQSMGIGFRVVEQLDAAFETAPAERAGLMIEIATPAVYAPRGPIAELAMDKRIATIAPFSEFAEAGGLISYGTSVGAIFRQAAGHIDRILRGASPADLPIEQPGKLELCINLKTAGLLGLTIPPALLAQADRGIE